MKKILPIALAIIVVGLGAFFGGMKYGESASAQANAMGGNFVNVKNLRNMSPEERQQAAQSPWTSSVLGERAGAKGGNFPNGEIISSDDKSVTVKLLTGGSKIVFLSDSTKITKTVDASSADLSAGTNIAVNGSQNSDGSITAAAIQIRPVQSPSQQTTQQQAQQAATQQ